MPLKLFQIFLSGGADSGKGFLIMAVTEYLKQALRYPNQNPDEPSLLVTASTGKADAGIYDITFCILSPC